MSLIDDLNWRYATKRFDSTKKVSKEDLRTVKEVIRLSASSYGLQPYEVMVIESQELKEKLRPACWNQPQLEEASAVFVFCNKSKVSEHDINEYVKLKAQTQGLKVEDLKGYADFMVGKICKQDEAWQSNWTARQAYIALGNLLMSCANLKIDACPMEGFEAPVVDEILDLKAKGLTTAVIATIGYRSKEDQTADQKKVRKAEENLFTHL